MWFARALLASLMVAGAIASPTRGSPASAPWVWVTAPHRPTHIPLTQTYPPNLPRHNSLHATPRQRFSAPRLVFPPSLDAKRPLQPADWDTVFSAPGHRRQGVIDLGDGTTIGGSIPEDTLLLSDPKANKHGKKKPRYTTIDRHLASKSAHRQDTESLSSETLGGLRPHEVFYANDHLLILKGGAFPEDKTYLRDNSITDSTLKKDTKAYRPSINLIPNGLITRVPAPDRFKINRKQDLKLARQDSAPLLRRKTRSSNEDREVVRPLVEPEEVLVFSPSRKRSVSSGSKVVHYHYQSRGKGTKPFVDYKIHKDGTFTNVAAKRGAFVPSKKPIVAQKQQQQKHPEFIPSAQVPTQFAPSTFTPSHPPGAHTFEEFPPASFAPSPSRGRTHSLRGDTLVNFLPPLPSRNTGAELVPHRRVPKSIQPHNHARHDRRL